MSFLDDFYGKKPEKLNGLQVLEILVSEKIITQDEINIKENSPYKRLVEFGCNYTEEEFIKVIKRVRRFSQRILLDAEKLSAVRFVELLDKYDKKFIFEMAKVYTKLKNEHNIAKETAQKIMNEMVDYFASKNKNVNDKIKLSTKDLNTALKKIVDIKSIIMQRTAQEREFERVFDNCIKNLQLFWKKTKVDNLEGLIEKLSTNIFSKNNHNNALTLREIIDLSDKCATIFMASNDEKLEAVMSEINSFKEYIKTLYPQNLDKQDIINAVENTSLLDVLKKAPTIAIEDAHNISFSMGLLAGKTFSECLKEYDRPLSNQESYLMRNYSDVKVNATFEDLARIYTSSITSLTVSPKNVADIVDYISDCFKQSYGEVNIRGEIITGNNFSQLKEINIKTLKAGNCLPMITKMLGKDKVLQLLKQDLTLLNLKEKDVQKNLSNVILTCVSAQELETKIIEILSTEVKKNKTNSKQAQTTNNSAHVVNHRLIKRQNASISFDQEDYIKMLRVCGIEEPTIENWIESYNAENAEWEALLKQEQLENERIQKELEAERQSILLEEESLQTAIGIIDSINNCLDNAKDLSENSSYEELLENYKYLILNKKMINSAIEKNKDSLIAHGLIDGVAEVFTELDNACQTCKLNINKILVDIQKVIDNTNKTISKLEIKANSIDSLRNQKNDFNLKMREMLVKSVTASVKDFLVYSLAKGLESINDRNTVLLDPNSDYSFITENETDKTKYIPQESLFFEYRFDEDFTDEEINRILKELRLFVDKEVCEFSYTDKFNKIAFVNDLNIKDKNVYRSFIIELKALENSFVVKKLKSKITNIIRKLESDAKKLDDRRTNINGQIEQAKQAIKEIIKLEGVLLNAKIDLEDKTQQLEEIENGNI